MLRDPYHLEFLEVESSAKERDLERALLTHLRDFLLELGVGFALVGSQYGLEVGGQDYRIDLLFYHLTSTLPRALRGKLPSPEELRRGLESGG